MMLDFDDGHAAGYSGVCHHHDAGGEAGGLDEFERRGDPFEEPDADADVNWVHPEVEFVDELVLDQGSVELAGAVLQDVAAGLRLQVGDSGRDISAEH